MRKVVVNTTPIIALANIGYLNLLHELYDEIIIPSAVNNEIISEPARSLVDSCNWLKINNVTDDAWNRMVFSTRLHAGEAEVILLAKECRADLLIIDDNAAKKTAKYLGMTVTGTMGVLLKAKREGYIVAVKPLLKSLIEDGFYVSTAVQSYVMEQSGETWEG